MALPPLLQYTFALKWFVY